MSLLHSEKKSEDKKQMVKLTLINYDSKLWKICEMPNNQDLTRIYDLGDQLSITVGIWEHIIIKTWNNLFYKIQDQNPKIWFVFRDWRNKLHYFFLGFYWFSSLDLFLIEKKTPLWALTPRQHSLDSAEKPFPSNGFLFSTIKESNNFM